MRFAHTNLVARDWKALAGFYGDVFGCVPVPPVRDQQGEWLERGTGVEHAALHGVHLRLPGGGPAGPTLEIFTWSPAFERPMPAPNQWGAGHLAFEVEDVEATLRDLLEAGGSRAGEVVTREIPGAGRLAFTYARDPEGNLVELQSWTRPEGASAAVASGYDAWASTYDSDDNPTRDLDGLVLDALLPDVTGLHVLELGCGTGRNTERLSGAAEVLALDLSEGMLALARDRVEAPDVRFVQHDLQEGLPVPSASFDLVLEDLVLEHVPSVVPVLAEVCRVLVPGGRAVVIELHPCRQRRGVRPRYKTPDGTVEVKAWTHPLSEWFDAARHADLDVVDVLEWDDEGPIQPGEDREPRVLVLVLRRPGEF